MKKFYYLLCICCVTAMFMACTDDDNTGKDEPGTEGNQGNEGNEGNQGNKPTEVRKIKRIAEVYKEGSMDLMYFEYVENTIKGIGYDYGEETFFRLTLENEKVEVMCRGNEATSTLPLEQGRVIRGKCSFRDVGEIRFDYDSCYCSYENGYLKQMLVRNYHQTPYGSNNQPELYITDNQYDFVFNDGYLLEEKCNNRDGEKEIIKYSYSDKVRNDANIDLLIFLRAYFRDSKYLFQEDDILCLRLCGLLGHPTKALPSEITFSQGTWNLSYATDEEGYPTEIKIKKKNSGEETGFNIYY